MQVAACPYRLEILGTLEAHLLLVGGHAPGGNGQSANAALQRHCVIVAGELLEGTNVLKLHRHTGAHDGRVSAPTVLFLHPALLPML